MQHVESAREREKQPAGDKWVLSLGFLFAIFFALNKGNFA